MEEKPVVLEDEYHNKQTDQFLSPIRAAAEDTYKTFKYNHNSNDRTRVKVRSTL